MNTEKVYTVIGLMSGTSLDGIDAALIRTDGVGFARRLHFISMPYDDDLRAQLRACLGQREDPDGRINRTALAMTQAHAAAVDWVLARAEMNPADIDLIGFHGQTVFHAPQDGFTWQIGHGGMLARLCGIPVVYDFRSADVAAGGEGAPLIPLYHAALAADLEKPAAILNIGGVGNMTYIGARPDEILAFDTGPGNALMDDYMKTRTGHDFDESGLYARQGQASETVLEALLSHSYFDRKPPKSLDRDEWDVNALLASLSAPDAMATLAAFTVQSIAAGFRHLPDMPRALYVTGGGRHNRFVMDMLARRLNIPVRTVDDLGWDGDALEAEGFAYLAVRSVLGLPLSLPTTTGVAAPQTGGVLHMPACREQNGEAAS